MEQVSINPSDVLGVLFILILVAKLYSFVKTKSEENKYKVDRRKPPQKMRLLSEEEREKQAIVNQQKAKAAFDEYYRKLLGDKEFVNQNTTELSEFIINEEINQFDLFKLAQLNGIKLEFNVGWYDLVIELIQELNELGWNRQVGCIKEKFGELRFYTNHAYEEIIDKYTDRSREICERCGKSGELRVHGGWMITLCEAHNQED